METGRNKGKLGCCPKTKTMKKIYPSKNDSAPEGAKLWTAEGTGRPVLPWKEAAGATFWSLKEVSSESPVYDPSPR